MDRKTRWRTFWLLVLVVLSVAVLVPSVVPSDRVPSWVNKFFNKKVQLGLDLQGGLHIVYGIDLNKAVDDKAAELKRDFEADIATNKISAKVSTPLTPIGAVTITATSAEELAKVNEAFLKPYVEVVIKRDCPADTAEHSVCMRVSSDYAAGIKDSALKQAVATVRDRINERGVAEPTVITKGDSIIVELPGREEEDIQRDKATIERTAKLEFKIVEENSPLMKDVIYPHVNKQSSKPDSREKELGITGEADFWQHEESGRQYNDYYLIAEDRSQAFSIAEAKQRGCYNRNMPVDEGKVWCQVTGRAVLREYFEELAQNDKKFKPDDDHEFGYEHVTPEDPKRKSYWRTYYLARAVELSGSGVSAARVVANPTTGKAEVLVDFTRWGGRRFGELTGKNVGRKMAIILDDKINSAPIIQGAITGGSSTISMGGTNDWSIQNEAQDLVNVLRSGSLPAPLTQESSSTIGPLLGRDAIEKTKLSFLLGSGLVVLIMIFVYRASGFISIFALVLNILFMLAVLAVFQATLTLPGIAALVLTVGMAVDANIIIYERIREELRLGKSVRGAVDAGFSRGLAAILDGQITTALAAYILFQYGSGPIKGFAVMLMIGIVCTLFTATWCTRLFFEYYVGRGRKSVTLAI